jgi:hypothetical protein
MTNKSKIVKLVLIGTSFSALSHATLAQNQESPKKDSLHHTSSSYYHSSGRLNFVFHSCDDGWHPFRVFRSRQYLNNLSNQSQPHFHEKSLSVANNNSVKSSNSTSNTSGSRVARGGFGTSAHTSAAA